MFTIRTYRVSSPTTANTAPSAYIHNAEIELSNESLKRKFRSPAQHDNYNKNAPTMFIDEKISLIQRNAHTLDGGRSISANHIVGKIFIQKYTNVAKSDKPAPESSLDAYNRLSHSIDAMSDRIANIEKNRSVYQMVRMETLISIIWVKMSAWATRMWENKHFRDLSTLTCYILWLLLMFFIALHVIKFTIHHL
jgi:hypothetical protein